MPQASYAIAIMRPAAALELDGITPWPVREPFKADDIERVVAALFPDSQQSRLDFGFLIQTKSDLDKNKVARSINARASLLPDGRQAYIDSEGISFRFVDERTVLVSPNFGFIFAFPEKPQSATHRLSKLLGGADPKAHFLAVADLDHLRNFAIATLPELSAPWLKRYPILKSIQSLRLQIDLAATDAITLTGTTDASSAKDLAQTVMDTLKSEALRIATLVRNDDQSKAKALPNPAPAGLEELLGHVEISSQDRTWTLISRNYGHAKPLTLIEQLVGLQASFAPNEQDSPQFRSSLRQVGFAIHRYYAAYRTLPKDFTDDSGKRLLSWRVRILPFLQQTALFKKFHLDEAWDSPHNIALLPQMPDFFKPRANARAPSETSILQITGTQATTFNDVLSPGHTLLAIEAETPVPWTKPIDFEPDSAQPFNGLHQPEASAILYDASTVAISNNVDSSVLKKAMQLDKHDFPISELDSRTDRVGTMGRQQNVAESLKAIGVQLDRKDEDQIAAGLQSLANIPTVVRFRPKVNQKVMGLLASKSPLVRTGALQALIRWKSSPPNADTIRRLLNEEYDACRWLTIDLLTGYPDSSLVMSLIKTPLVDYPRVQLLLYQSWAEVAADGAIPALEEADPNIAARAAWIVAVTGSDKHVPKLQELHARIGPEWKAIVQQAIDHLQSPGPVGRIMATGASASDAFKKVAVKFEEKGDQIIALDLDRSRNAENLTHSDFQLFKDMKHVESLQLTQMDCIASDISCLRHLPLRTLAINFCSPINDSVAQHLSSFKRLESLDIAKTNVGDLTATAVGQLENLKVLVFGGTHITDEGIKKLSNLQQLTELNLSDTLLSDESRSVLTTFTNLQYLYVMNTDITDTSLDSFSKLTKLKRINLSQTAVTKPAIAKLKAALPDCDVISNVDQ